MKNKLIALLAGLGAFGVAHGTWAQEVLGPLSNSVNRQLLKGWEAGEEGGWFVLRNTSLEGSEQALTVNAGQPSEDGRKTAVTVSLNSNLPGASIGLLVRNPGSGDLCLMDVTAEGEADLFCIIDDNRQSIASVPGAARMDGSDVISMIELPGAARFFVNDTLMGDVSYTSALGAEIGIMAYGRGTFGVADFQISDMSPARTGSSPSAGSGLPPKGGPGGKSGSLDTGGDNTGGDGRMAAIMGPLADEIESSAGQDGWELFFEDDWLVLVNSATASSELVFTLPAGPVSSGERITSLEIGILPPQGRSAADFPHSAAGILVESSDRKASCVGEITGAGDGLALCFGEDGKSREIGRLPGAAKGGGQDLLQFVEGPGYGDFLLNGMVIGRIGNSPVLGGDIGVLAYERGEFYVRGFSVSSNEAAASSAATTPAGGGVPMFGNDQARRIGIYLGLTNSIFMHELGHALIGELILPSTGPEEDAVDIFSALRVVEPTMYPSNDPSIDAIGREVATYAALQWYYSGMLAEQHGFATPWQDEHTPDLKRFRNVFCIMYGGNPGVFSGLANQVDLDERTLSRCDDEFNKQNRAWRAILAPHTRVGTWHPEGQLPADAPGAPIEVTFEPSRTEVGEFVRTTFADGLRSFADQLTRTYVLPRPIAVTYRDCGEFNAWYNPREGSITMCYDLIEDLVFMISDIEMGSDGGAATSRQPGGNADVANFPAGTGGIDEAADLGVPATSVLFSAPYKGPTPTRHTRAELVTTEDLAVAINRGDQMLLVDTSGSSQTIPGAVSVVDAGKDGSLTDSFQSIVDGWLNQQTGGDTGTAIVFFGEGLLDRSSYNAALRAGALGWNAYWYRGGTEAWVSNGLPLASSVPPEEQTSSQPANAPNEGSGSGERFAIYEGVDFYGADIAEIRADDLMQCFQACVENSRCLAMTMNLDPQFKNGPNCFLKDGSGRIEFYEQAVSGAFLASDFDGVLEVEGAAVSPTTIIE